MNNRYLFRAKRIDNGEWMEGFYALIGKKHVIISKESEGYYTESVEERHGNEIVNADPSTICQCTGLRDKHGKLILEHEIVRECYSEYIGEVKFGVHEKGYGWYIEWISEMSKFYRVDFLYWQKEVSLEVVGNIFDNPELLKAGECV